MRQLAAVASVGLAALVARPQNPTQTMGKLLELMRTGLPQGENTTAFDQLYAGRQGNEQQTGAGDKDVANSFYNLATQFYEYGWGDSFHFGWRRRGEPHRQSTANSQNFVAQKLRVGDMSRVLDLGCGIGGPLRGVVRATGANVTGLTINEHQVARAREITAGLTPYMQARCHFEVQDYLNIVGMEADASRVSRNDLSRSSAAASPPAAPSASGLVLLSAASAGGAAPGAMRESYA